MDLARGEPLDDFFVVLVVGEEGVVVVLFLFLFFVVVEVVFEVVVGGELRSGSATGGLPLGGLGSGPDLGGMLGLGRAQLLELFGGGGPRSRTRAGG